MALQRAGFADVEVDGIMREAAMWIRTEGSERGSDEPALPDVAQMRSFLRMLIDTLVGTDALVRLSQLCVVGAAAVASRVDDIHTVTRCRPPHPPRQPSSARGSHS